MGTDIEGSKARPPMLKRAAAGMVLIAVAALAVWVVIGVIKTIFFITAGIAVVIAVLWALKTIVW
jgi:hypothetical protein